MTHTCVINASCLLQPAILYFCTTPSRQSTVMECKLFCHLFAALKYLLFFAIVKLSFPSFSLCFACLSPQLFSRPPANRIIEHFNHEFIKSTFVLTLSFFRIQLAYATIFSLAMRFGIFACNT